MASPINTGGFGVGERLQPQYLDPRLLAPDPSRIYAGLQQGMGTAGQFAQIMDNAEQRPIRRQLQQIQLEEARARMDMLPIQQQLQMLQLGEAQQQAAVPFQIVDDETIVGGAPSKLSANNLDAGFGNIEFITEGPTPRELITSGRSVAAGGAITPFERRKTLATGQQVQAEASRNAADIENKATLAESRLSNAKTASEAAQARAEVAKEQLEINRIKAENDRIKADAAMMRAQDIRSNPDYEESAVTQDENGNVVLNFVNKRTMERIAIPTNQARSATSNFFFGGGRPTAPAVTPNAAIDPEIAALANLVPGGAKPASAAAVPRAFSSAAEAQAAFDAGTLKKGTKIIVGGVPGTWN